MSFGQQVLCTQQGSTILYANQDLAEMEKKIQFPVAQG